MRQMQLGTIGGFVGDHTTAPTSVAVVVVVCGFLVIVAAMAAEYSSPGDTSFWKYALGGAITLVGSSLGYVFGRGAGHSHPADTRN